MVTALAVSSIEKKLEMQVSIIVGNYEFYYACGKLSAITNLAADETTAPLEMKEKLEEALVTFQPAEEDAQGNYLKTLLEKYRPSDEYDEQMAELFLWGKNGKQA